MKKQLYFWAACVCMALSFSACSLMDQDFDETLIIGTWTVDGNSTDHWRFDAGGTGASWDEADDVTEEEAQAFSWSISGSELTIVHQIGMTGQDAIPKSYKLTELTATHMTFKDTTTGKSISLTKIR